MIHCVCVYIRICACIHTLVCKGSERTWCQMMNIVVNRLCNNRYNRKEYLEAKNMGYPTKQCTMVRYHNANMLA